MLIDVPHDLWEQRLVATRQALEQGAPAVYEAAFRADGVFVSVDILGRHGRGFCLTEVKSTTGVKELSDVAVQAHVVRRSGLEVSRMEGMHLNRACAYPDLSDLFVRADVTELVRARLGTMPREIAGLVSMLAAVPSLSARLESIAAQVTDLLPVVRNHVYHPDFGGGFSLKRVLPALVPAARYDGLAIAEGGAASLELARLLFHADAMAPAERERVRRELLEYCHRDTWGLVKLLERLRVLAITDEEVPVRLGRTGDGHTP